MIDNKKEQERDELHRTIWSMANDLFCNVKEKAPNNENLNETAIIHHNQNPKRKNWHMAPK